MSIRSIISRFNSVATAKLQTLAKLLFLRWRGSVLKLLWRDLVLYNLIFWIINAIQVVWCYKLFKDMKYHEVYTKYVPLSLFLGFFVTNVMVRWWDQFMNIPWPYSIGTYVSSTIHGYDEVGRAMRRTIMRYTCLSLTMVFRVLSRRVRARFPQTSDLITAGLLTNSELKIIESLEEKYPNYGKNFLPIVWACSIVSRARAEGRIRDDVAAKSLIKQLNLFRSMCGTLINYSAICIPLVYLQVVTLAVYAYFVFAMIDLLDDVNLVEGNCNSALKFGDIFSSQSMASVIQLQLQFFVYMGWLKVAETMLNPWGDDDDDFEVLNLIDSNLQMSYLIVDEMHNEHPELLKDQYWDEMPKKLNDRSHTDITNKGTTPAIITDAESPQTSEESVSPYKHLIPSATIIDPHYLNKPDIEAEQSFFNIFTARESKLPNSANFFENERSRLNSRRHSWYNNTVDESRIHSELELKKTSLKPESETVSETTSDKKPETQAKKE